MNLEKNEITCPKCSSPLKDISEEFRSLTTYHNEDGVFKVEKGGSSEEYHVKCKMCGADIPDKVMQMIIPLLPKA